ncbi:MAG: protein jag [Clostridia bacterium]|nr:protein jag [Clostridia bacterium]
MTELIKEAATVEEAKAAILAELALPEERVTFEVLQEPQKKVLGLFGGSDARVKGTVKAGAADAAADYLRQVLAAMGAGECKLDVKEEDNTCVITLDGEDLGFVIGRRGDTLDALQYLTGLVANRAGGGYYRVTIDIGNYREKREQALTGLARKVGNQVARTGRKSNLEPMNPYERRIVHTAVQDIEGVTSWSVGSEPNRHVVIGPSEDNPNKDKARSGRGGRGRGKGRGGNRENREPRENREGRDSRPRRDGVAEDRPARPIRTFVPRSNPLPTADGATPPSRTESEKEQSASLYGRIDL